MEKELTGKVIDKTICNRTDSGASDTMLNSLMYKLSYYRFDEMQT